MQNEQQNVTRQRQAECYLHVKVLKVLVQRGYVQLKKELECAEVAEEENVK